MPDGCKRLQSLDLECSGTFSLARFPVAVTQEVAGSSPVDPAKVFIYLRVFIPLLTSSL